MKQVGIISTSLLLWASLSLAQTDPPYSFDPDDQPHTANAVDSVSPFNGQLALSVPIGPAYTVGPGLSFQIELHYSSRVWMPGQWRIFSLNTPPEPFMVLDGDPALGLGWRFSLGQIVESGGVPQAYVGPDAFVHRLYDRRRAGDSADGFFYTRDGSYLRVKNLGGGTGYEMRSPDGKKTTFGPAGHVTGKDDAVGWLQSDYGRGRNGWHATAIANPYGDQITIAYQSSPYEWVPSTITVPSVGGSGTRTITVNFNRTSGTSTTGLITGFTLPTFGGALSTWNLDYDAQGQRHFPIRRPLSGHPTIYITNPPTAPNNPPNGAPAPPPTHFLTSIRTPIFGHDSSFTYWDNSSFDQPHTSYGAGALKTQTIPTGATITYEYGTWTVYHANPLNRPDSHTCSYPPSVPLPTRPILVTGPGLEPLLPQVSVCESPDRMAGVVRRTVGFNGAVTQYFQYSFPQGETNVAPASQTETIVVSPADDAGKKHSVSYLFSASDDKGLSDPLTASLQRRAVFTGDVSTRSVFQSSVCPILAFCTTRAERLEKFTWEADSSSSNSVTTANPPAEANRRVKRVLTFFNGVPPDRETPTSSDRYHKVDYEFDPVAGRHSRETHSGNVGGTVASDARDLRTTWTPLIDSTHWKLDLASQSELRSKPADANPFATVVTSSFDPFGFVLETKTVDGGPFGTLTRTITRDSQHGFPSTERVSLGTSSYTRTLTFVSGTQASSQWSGIGWKSFDNAVDSSTGLVSNSKDPNGLATGMTYDALGRPRRTTPQGGDAPTETTYDSPNQTTTFTSDSREYAWSQQQTDSLGRPIKMLRRMPGGITAKKVFRYDQQGHKIFESEWVDDAQVADSAAPGTTWSQFDDFGRAGSVKRADQTTTSIRYDDGIYSSSTWSRTVTIDNVGGAPATTTYTYDAFGNLVRVKEPTPTLDETTYAYNPQDRLIRVTQGEQTRAYTYDAFGFLRDQTLPERGNLTVSYLSYDALGNLLTESYPGNKTTYRSFAYDGAGRLLQVTAAGQAYLRNEYDGAVACTVGPDGCPNGGLYKLGRLTRQTGYNPSAGISVVQDMFYSDGAGRLSARETRAKNGTSFLTTVPIAEGWVYDPSGLVAQYAHPRGAGAGMFTVSTNFDHGLPVRVSANGLPVAMGATYYASGMLASYMTGDDANDPLNTKTTIVQDSSGMPRPRQISAAPVYFPSNLLLDTGIYSYDGAGNVTNMGADIFGYDRLSRLKSATLGGLPAGSDRQSYTYDRYGNLNNRDGVHAQTLPIDTGTNRLADTVDPTKYQYDTSGNLRKAGSETYTYDDLNRLVGYGQGGLNWTYLYDAHDERLIKIPPAGGSQNYTWTFRDDANRIATESLGASQSRDNVYLGNLLVGSYATCPTGSWTYYSADHLGTPRLATSATGALLDQRRYWPFGDVASALDPNAPQRLGLAQMERDSEGSRYYDHARSHDFGLGRFLSLDRTGGDVKVPQSLNAYSYALGNPLRYTDPNGEFPALAAGVIVFGGYVEGFSREVNYARSYSNATNADFAREFSIGFVAGATAAGVGIGVTRATKNPFLVGAAVAETDAVVTQGMEFLFNRRSSWDASDVAVKTVLGAFAGKLADLMVPRLRGPVPRYFRSRPWRELFATSGPGRNSNREFNNRNLEAYLINRGFSLVDRLGLGEESAILEVGVVDGGNVTMETRFGPMAPEEPPDPGRDTSEDPVPNVQWN